MDASLLVTPQTLAAMINAPELIVLDCTSAVVPSDAAPGFALATGEQAFEQGHIPGAQFVDIERDLSRPAPGLLFTLPDAPAFGAAMSRLGIGANSRVVLYSAAQPGWAARVWLMMWAFGFRNASVLDGGLAAWQAAGLSLETGPGRPRSAPESPIEWRLEPGYFVDMAATNARGDAALVNALGSDAFRGESNIVYHRPGRIPGSVSLPTAWMVDPDSGCYHTPEKLQHLFASAGIAPDQPLIAYCGAGIAASNIVFTRILSGAAAPAAVFDGSLLEWMSDPARSAEIG